MHKNAQQLPPAPGGSDRIRLPVALAMAAPIGGATTVMATRHIVFVETLEGNQKYNALQAHVRKRFAFGMEYQLGYTFSKGMTDAQGYYGSPGQAAGTGAYTQDLYDRKAEWGPTFFDNKHNLSGSFVYALPFGRRKPIQRDLSALCK